MARRREEILLAAQRIIAEDGVAALTMKRLSEEVSLSIATLYNLVGTHEDVLIAQLRAGVDRLQGRLADLDGADPVQDVRTLMLSALDVLLEDASISKATIAGSVELARRGVRPAQADLSRRLATISETALRRCRKAGLLEPDVRIDLLSDAIVMRYTYATELWSFGLLRDEQLRATVLYDVEILLTAALTQEQRKIQRTHLKKAQTRMERAAPWLREPSRQDKQ